MLLKSSYANANYDVDDNDDDVDNDDSDVLKQNGLIFNLIYRLKQQLGD